MDKLFTTPLSDDQAQHFIALAKSLNPVQLAWVSGYTAALLANRNGQMIQLPTDLVSSSSIGSVEITILFGSHTGNGKALAKQAAQLSQELGLKVQVKDMESYKTRDLQHEKNLLVIVSTHGEGEPPLAAKELYQFIHGKRAPMLDQLKFAVLALGDSSYFQFCKTGIDFDGQLEKLGAKRLVPISTFDVDFKAKATEWLGKTLPLFLNGHDKAQQAVKTTLATSPETSSYSKEHPLQANIVARIGLHGRGSDRETLHLEIEAELDYEPGDSAGILPVNNTALVNEVLAVTGLEASAPIDLNGNSLTLFDALKHRIELSKLTIDVVKRYIDLKPKQELSEIASSAEKLQEYLYGRDVVDLLTEFPIELTAQQLAKLLRPLQPRLYSIASSPVATPGELHLTVGVVDYQNKGRSHMGACSNYLNEIDIEKESISLFIEKNPNFKLPENPDTPMIMVGAGTGIAPFRAFVQHREQTGSRGKNWLIFGNRHFETEFLYQTEWLQLIKSGVLTRMDVAFSRDSDKKVYVQDRLAENAAEVYKWISEGANFYLCGDMKKMATDVQDTLVSIIEEQAALTHEQAMEFVNQLQKDRRLQLDVY
jgi:sulfite reductase (NADPH) flavoprotein alpha-component